MSLILRNRYLFSPDVQDYTAQPRQDTTSWEHLCRAAASAEHKQCSPGLLRPQALPSATSKYHKSLCISGYHAWMQGDSLGTSSITLQNPFRVWIWGRHILTLCYTLLVRLCWPYSHPKNKTTFLLIFPKSTNRFYVLIFL